MGEPNKVSDPPAIPEPPVDLASRTLPLEILPAGREIFRIHQTSMSGKFFGRQGNWRFDSPNNRFGTLYAGLSEHVCFIETLLRGKGCLVAESELQIRSFCRFTTSRQVRLVQLYGRHLAPLGASAAVTSIPDYSVSMRWSQALHSHRDQPDGILYKSNYDNDEFALVLFCRAENAIDGGISSPLMSDIAKLGNILDRYKASLR